MDMREALATLRDGGTLGEDAARAVFDLILGGGADEAQIGALLALLATRGPTADELTGAARAMRAVVAPVPVADSARGALVDTCGTGGAPKTFNVSTGAAIVAAGAGGLDGAGARVRVAKHGNRSRTGRGSAEVLTTLGVNVDASPETQARCLEEAGVCFCFAIHHHPAMRYAAGPRKSLGMPTIFNLLGPLTNPAGATRQLLGVYDRRFVGLVAECLSRLGAERAIVAHGLDGLDEMTTTAPTAVAEVGPGGVREGEVDAGALGVARATLDDLRETTLDDAAAAIERILGGEAGPRADIVALNAGAALVVGGAAADLGAGVALAREAIASGGAARALEALRDVSASA